MLIKLNAGDPSHDGHGLTESFVIESNLSLEHVREAYKVGCGNLGFDFEKTIARNYEDSTVTIEQLAALRKIGWKESEGDDPIDADPVDLQYLQDDDYVTMWLAVVKAGNPTFQYSFVTDDSAEINIGGYGLYST